MNSAVTLLLASVLAAVLGFAVHRANVCTVRAVAEIFSTRRAYMLAAFAKTALWVMAITLPLAWWLGDAAVSATTWPASLNALLGGFVFGMGAAFNRGCAFSTLAKLADGDLSRLASVSGFALGVCAYGALVTAQIVHAAEPLEHEFMKPGLAGIVVVAVLWIWGCAEIVRLVRSRESAVTWRHRLRTDVYRLSTAAILLGLANGAIYVLVGAWPWTTVVSGMVGAGLGMAPPPPGALWILLAAVLAGMSLSSWDRGSHELRWRLSRAWIVQLLAGGLMGLGAALAPGGNDVLILHSIPSLSPHALPALAAIIVGIAVPMVAMRYATGTITRVDCGGDVCRTDGK